jgi:hypothetical protein
MAIAGFLQMNAQGKVAGKAEIAKIGEIEAD